MRRLTGSVLAVLMVVSTLVGPAAVAAHAESLPAAPVHPRLVFSADDVPAMRERVTAGEPALAWAKLKEKVDSYTTPGHPNYVDPALVNDPTPVTVREGGLKLGENQDWAYYDGIFVQNEMRTYLIDLAFAYVLSGQERYGRHAVALLLELSVHWPAWSKNELGEGDLTTGVALSFDWTYDLMSVEERRRITDSLVGDLQQTNPVARDGNFPAPSVFSCLDRDFHFDQTWFNWTGVCGGGNGLTLLAIEGEPGVPDLEPWMTVVRDRVFGYFQRGFGSQGDGAEGVTYAGYGLHNALPFAFAYERLHGVDGIAGTGLAELPVWLAFEQQPGRGTRFVPRNDSAESLPILHEVIPMLFNVRADGVPGWLYDHTVGPQGDAVFTAEPAFVAYPVTGNHTCTDPVQDPNRLVGCWRSAEVFTILYYEDPDELPRADPSSVTERSRFYPEYGLVNARTGWEQGSGEVLATFEAKHDHPGGHFQEDMGSFTLYGYGGRFALDSGYGSNYHCHTIFPALQGCSPQDSRMNNGRDVGHNVPIVGEWRDSGRRTQYRYGVGAAKPDTIGTYLDSPDRTLVRSDLRNAYNIHGTRGDAKYAERDMLFSRTPGQPVMLATADRLNLDGQPHDYEWQMHTDGGNLVTTDGSRFTIRAPSGGTLTAVMADAQGPRAVKQTPWPYANYTLFDQPLTHTLVTSEDSQQWRASLEHLAVTALTAPGEQPAVVTQQPATGGSVVSVAWGSGEALFASASYGSAGVSSERRLATDGELAQVTVLGSGAGDEAAETVLAGGTSLLVDGRTYVDVVGGPATVVTSGDTIRADGPAAAAYRVLAPQQVDTVTVNGISTRACREGDYVSFPCRQETSVQLSVPTTGTATDITSVTATLTAAEAPVAGQPVEFSIGALTATAITDADGVASADIRLDIDTGEYPVTARYAGDSQYSPSSATGEMTIAPDETAVVYTGETEARGEDVEVSAVLTEDGGVPLPGQQVVFSSGESTVTATTDASGRASAVLTIPEHGRSTTVTARFPGAVRHAPSSTSATVTWGSPPS